MTDDSDAAAGDGTTAGDEGVLGDPATLVRVTGGRELHRADAFEALAALPADAADAAVVDYPWRIEITTASGEREHRNTTTKGASGVRVPDGEAAMFETAPDDRLPEVVAQLRRVVASGGWLLFLADDTFQETVRAALRDAEGVVFRRNWAWTPPTPGTGHYGRVDHYPVPVATVGETDRTVTDRGTLHEAPRGDADYPTAKHPALYRSLLSPPVTRPGDRLLEPFCGSAPGAAVAASRGLDYWGCDVDAAALDLAADRLSQARIGGQWRLDDCVGGAGRRE